MTEEEQIAYAMQMSMAENEGGEGGSEEKMDVDDKDQDYSEVMNDPEFLQSVLQVNVIPIAQCSRLVLRIVFVSISPLFNNFFASRRTCLEWIPTLRLYVQLWEP